MTPQEVQEIYIPAEWRTSEVFDATLREQSPEGAILQPEFTIEESDAVELDRR